MNYISPSIRPGRLRKPVIYFGGRMSLCAECSHDWRHGIVGADVLPDDMEYTVGPHTVVEFDSFLYGGPYLIDGTGGHARGHCHGYDDKERQRIWDNDMAQIARADLFLCYLQDMEAYGSLVEIGLARAMGKPIALGLSARLTTKEIGELWFAVMAATEVYRGTPTQFWEQVAADWIATTNGGRP